MAQAAELQLLVSSGKLPPKKRSKCAQGSTNLLVSSRKLLARNESGQSQLNLANTGRLAAEEQYDQLSRSSPAGCTARGRQPADQRTSPTSGLRQLRAELALGRPQAAHAAGAAAAAETGAAR